ncbi:MAG: pyrroline-5-carboxylate reductase [Syntrophales bacterium]|nr:pyrroline-5-carboxylate reductase [Syntrophales bacterium]
MLEGKRICIIGGGKMGGALVGGMVSRRIKEPQEITVTDIDTERLAELRDSYGVLTGKDNAAAVKEAQIVILAVKPQIMGEVLAELTHCVDKHKLIISIAAGITIAFIEGYLKQGVRVIRTMPNTPALIGEGMTALALGTKATEEDLTLAKQIFDAVGKTVVVKEELMDAVTGLSGSGPAYGFIIIEALADGGVQMGLPRDTAVTLAAQTMLGAAKLVLMGQRHTGQLKDMVTSPGGTTIAGIRALEGGALRGTLMAAVEAATLRSKALGG